MEEIQIREALRFHVTNGEPPMGLSAAGLLAQGRRRHWRQVCVASGGTVAMIALVGAIALVPGGAADPLAMTCSVPVVTDFNPRPSSSPDHPMPSDFPSADPTPNATGAATPDPSDHPTADPTHTPSAQATHDPTPEPSSNSSGPSFGPAIPSDVPDEPRMRKMECYLKRELQRMVPGAKFASDFGPLKVYTVTGPRPDGVDPGLVYFATAIVIGRAQTMQIQFTVQRLLEPQPTAPGNRWPLFEKHGDLVARYMASDRSAVSEVYTPYSRIGAYATGTLLSPEQLIELSSATEMDMFR